MHTKNGHAGFLEKVVGAVKMGSEDKFVVQTFLNVMQLECENSTEDCHLEDDDEDAPVCILEEVFVVTLLPNV